MKDRLKDEIVLNLVPEPEKKRIREFRESYSSFRRSWRDYLKEINDYREGKK